MPIYASALNVDKNQPPPQFKPAPLWLWPLGQGGKTETKVPAWETHAAKLH